MLINWKKGQINGVIIKKLDKHLDERGFLCETFRADELPSDLKPLMSYVSYTEPGIIRGPHEHKYQTDIFAFLGPGNFMLKLWDNRTASATFGSYLELYCGADNPAMVIIPPGIVHGYKNITAYERGMVLNYPDTLFKGAGRTEPIDEIRHEDDPASEFRMEE